MRSFWATLERLADTSSTINNTLLARDLTILTRNIVSLRLLSDAVCDRRKLPQFIIQEISLGVSELFMNSYLMSKISSSGVANLSNSVLLRAIRALNLNILAHNLLRPE